MTFEWEDPPPPRPGGNRASQAQQLAARLRTKPGEWARIGEYLRPSSAQQRARDISHGIPRAFQPRGAYEARVSGGKVWARYTEEAADAVNEQALRRQAAWEQQGGEGEVPPGWEERP
jgi:hypothetical protein